MKTLQKSLAKVPTVVGRADTAVESGQWGLDTELRTQILNSISCQSCRFVCQQDYTKSTELICKTWWGREDPVTFF